MEPLPRGSGVEFDEVVVGGAVPRQFFSSVEKGVHHQLERGLLAGWPVVDVKVTLTDGKAHSVDSSDVAFQTAAGLALRELASPSTMCLLEPIDTVTVTVDDELPGRGDDRHRHPARADHRLLAGRGRDRAVGARGGGAAARAARLRRSRCGRWPTAPGPSTASTAATSSCPSASPRTTSASGAGTPDGSRRRPRVSPRGARPRHRRRLQGRRVVRAPRAAATGRDAGSRSTAAARAAPGWVPRPPRRGPARAGGRSC